MLAVEDIHCSYGPIDALRGISIEASKGSVVCILGPNGAGKSTTLKAIAGMVRPRKGRVTLDGRDITRLGPSRKLSEGIALAPEGRRILEDFSMLMRASSLVCFLLLYTVCPASAQDKTMSIGVGYQALKFDDASFPLGANVDFVAGVMEHIALVGEFGWVRNSTQQFGLSDITTLSRPCCRTPRSDRVCRRGPGSTRRSGKAQARRSRG